MKIFHKPISNPKEVLEKNSFSHEQLLFPEYVFESLKGAFEESAELLPVSARMFQDWDVGLLERFGDSDFEGVEAKVGVTPVVEVGEGSGREEVQKTNGQKSEGPSIKEIPHSEALLE
jgi:hypothetical protein